MMKKSKALVHEQSCRALRPIRQLKFHLVIHQLSIDCPISLWHGSTRRYCLMNVI